VRCTFDNRGFRHRVSLRSKISHVQPPAFESLGPSHGTLCSCDTKSIDNRYLYIAIDKFPKWVEVEPVCTIPARSAVKFIRGLVCRFGVPNRIITDNGSQFTSGLF
jgi:hypothetical protein